jgi:hypothetical protein
MISGFPPLELALPDSTTLFRELLFEDFMCDTCLPHQHFPCPSDFDNYLSMLEIPVEEADPAFLAHIYDLFTAFFESDRSILIDADTLVARTLPFLASSPPLLLAQSALRCLSVLPRALPFDYLPIISALACSHGDEILAAAAPLLSATLTVFDIRFFVALSSRIDAADPPFLPSLAEILLAFCGPAAVESAPMQMKLFAPTKRLIERGELAWSVRCCQRISRMDRLTVRALPLSRLPQTVAARLPALGRDALDDALNFLARVYRLNSHCVSVANNFDAVYIVDLIGRQFAPSAVRAFVAACRLVAIDTKLLARATELLIANVADAPFEIRRGCLKALLWVPLGSVPDDERRALAGAMDEFLESDDPGIVRLGEAVLSRLRDSVSAVS